LPQFLKHFFHQNNFYIMERKTNWIAVVVSVVAAMAIGMLWYGLLFNQQWMDGNGITMQGDKMLKNGAEIPMSSMPMVLNTLGMVLNALILNWLFGRMNVTTLADGAMTGAAIGFIMAFGVMIGNMFASNPSSLTVVDGSYSFVVFTVIGAILGGWQKK
jgi:Protein of unknown function (DUF1761)